MQSQIIEVLLAIIALLNVIYIWQVTKLGRDMKEMTGKMEKWIEEVIILRTEHENFCKKEKHREHT